MLLNDLSLQQKIGQMLVTGFSGPNITEDFKALVQQYKIGNVILFRDNQQSFGQLTSLCQSLTGLIQNATAIPPFISSDEEGGVVSRMPADMAKMPSGMGQAALGDTQRIALAAQYTGRQLRAAGINFNLAPVLDVNNNLQNPVIGVRSYGINAQAVNRFALAALQGYQKSGILTTGKHFPGHGDTTVDSHLGLPVIHKDITQLEQLELLPFYKAFAAGLPAVTIAHILFPALEQKQVPATMSHAIITGLLREKMGFKGLVISDCMEMNAIKEYYGIAHATVEAVKAGMDLVFISHTPAEVIAATKALTQAVQSGEIPMQRIDDAVERILHYKSMYITAQPALPLAELAQMKEFAQQFGVAIIANSASKAGACFSLGENPLFISPLRQQGSRVANETKEEFSFAKAMQKRFGGKAVIIDNQPENVISQLVKQAAQHTSVVLGTVNGNIYPGQMQLADALAALPVPLACVALRNPFEQAMWPGDRFTLALYEYAPETVAQAMQFFKA